MKKLFNIILTGIVMTSILSSCCSPASSAQKTGWEQELASKMPYLGHRNWIVIADMAYPSQSGQGITTLFADEPYAEVLKKVKAMVDSAPHVFAHIYNDAELSFIEDADAPGVDAVRESIKTICGDESQRFMHEELISKLDKAGQLFNVVIIKTPLTIPYTTTFFELDCAYWDAARQAGLDAAMQVGK